MDCPHGNLFLPHDFQAAGKPARLRKNPVFLAKELTAERNRKVLRRGSWVRGNGPFGVTYANRARFNRRIEHPCGRRTNRRHRDKIRLERARRFRLASRAIRWNHLRERYDENKREQNQGQRQQLRSPHLFTRCTKLGAFWGHIQRMSRGKKLHKKRTEPPLRGRNCLIKKHLEFLGGNAERRSREFLAGRSSKKNSRWVLVPPGA
jgi:hypothetical protein